MASSLPWVAKIEELIETGPQEVNWLIIEVAGLVPPGRAWRAREWLRTYGARRKGLEPLPPGGITDEAIRSGQRAVVREAIGKLVYSGKARYLIQDDVKYLERDTYRRDAWRARRGKVAQERFRNMTLEEKAEWVEKVHANRTPEDRSEATRRGWKTRRRNASRSM